ncbi:FadR/GntR family transcriptional regulator [Alteromonas sp. 14N.309.X.WAT.G.H12]|uniref:FadR/GntR family transcriptional regulator n=1 Tax=Alteromonas sp. 14N.309.X.WAT.G.H12 TaxID=3120824 RepID=UPI002FD49BA9
MKSATSIANESQTKCPTEIFESVQQHSLSEAVVEQLENYILDGILRSGMQLPAERILAEQLGVSRPKLREALRILEERGLLEIHPGSGAVVAPLSGDVMTPALIALYCRHPRAIQDHLEYRKSQEVFAAQLASARATAEDKQGIQTILDEMVRADEQGDLSQALELDAQLHMAIVHASHNRTLIHMMASLYSLNRSGMFFSRSEILHQRHCAQTLLEQHLALGKAVIAGDTEHAMTLAAQHIDYVANALAQLLAQQQREALAAKRYA